MQIPFTSFVVFFFSNEVTDPEIRIKLFSNAHFEAITGTNRKESREEVKGKLKLGIRETL